MSSLETKPLVIFGCGGHARSVADVALSNGIGEILFVDPNARPAERVLGFPVITDIEFASKPRPDAAFFVALGDNRQRQEVFDRLVTDGMLPVALVARGIYRGAGVTIGDGAFVGAGAHLGPEARIGPNTIINTRSIVEHGSTVGAHTHVAVNVTLAGFVHIGDRAMIGAGATVIDRVSICSDTIIGAGSVVIADITEAGTYVGAPVRRVA